MVDFTKSINNEQMVEALNDLVRQNHDIMASYDKALEKLSDSGQRQRLGELREMHGRHIQQIAERVRILGGAPVEGQGGHKVATESKMLLAGMGKKNGPLEVMHSNEEQLKDAYVRTVDQFRASDEIVEVVNQVLDDSRDLRTWLEEEAGKSH